MKKIISLILALSMILSLLTILPVSAVNEEIGMTVSKDPAAVDDIVTATLYIKNIPSIANLSYTLSWNKEVVTLWHKTLDQAATGLGSLDDKLFSLKYEDPDYGQLPAFSPTRNLDLDNATFSGIYNSAYTEDGIETIPYPISDPTSNYTIATFRFKAKAGGNAEIKIADSVAIDIGGTSPALTKNIASPLLTVESPYPPIEPPPSGLAAIAPTNIIINNDGKITGTTTAMEYKGPTDPSYKPCTGTEITGLAYGTYKVRFKAIPGQFDPSDYVNVEVPRPGPTGLSVLEPTASGYPNGKITGTASGMEYKKADTADLYVTCPVPEITGLRAGNYLVRYSASAPYGPGADTIITLPDGPLNNQDPPIASQFVAKSPTTNGGFDGTIRNSFITLSLCEYKLSTELDTEYKPVTGTVITGPAGTYNIRYKAKTNYAASTPVDVVILPNTNIDQPAPSGLTTEGVSFTISNGEFKISKDGKIFGTNLAMIYKLSTDPGWSAVTGKEITSLDAGVYYVRYAKKPGYNEGPIATVIVKAYKSVPTDLTSTPLSSNSATNGSIGGVTSEMEYSLQNSAPDFTTSSWNLLNKYKVNGDAAIDAATQITSAYTEAKWADLLKCKTDGYSNIGLLNSDTATKANVVSELNKAIAGTADSAGMSYVITNQETLEFKKAVAQNILSRVLSTFVQSEYTTENWTLLTGYKSTGDEDVNSAETIADVIAAQNTAILAMAGVTSITDAVIDYKVTAAKILDAMLSVYAEINGINAALKTAVNGMNNTPTVTSVIADKRRTALEVLNQAFSTFSESDYSPENWAALTKFKTDGIANINAAKVVRDTENAIGILTKLNEAINGMAGVSTKSGSLADAKASAKKILTAILVPYTPAEYTPVTGTSITGLSAGIYNVRFKTTWKYLQSEPVKVVVVYPIIANMQISPTDRFGNENGYSASIKTAYLNPDMNYEYAFVKSTDGVNFDAPVSGEYGRDGTWFEFKSNGVGTYTKGLLSWSMFESGKVNIPITYYYKIPAKYLYLLIRDKDNPSDKKYFQLVPDINSRTVMEDFVSANSFSSFGQMLNEHLTPAVGVSDWQKFIGFKTDGDIAINAAANKSEILDAQRVAINGMLNTATEDGATADVKTGANRVFLTVLANESGFLTSALKAYKNAGDTAINGASNLSELIFAQNEAIDGMSEFATKIQDLPGAKATAISVLEEVYKAYPEPEYTAAGNWSALTTVKTNGDTAINNAASIDDVNNALDAALSGMLTVSYSGDKKIIAYRIIRELVGVYTTVASDSLNKLKTDGAAAVTAATDKPGTILALNTALDAMTNFAIAFDSDAKTMAINNLRLVSELYNPSHPGGASITKSIPEPHLRDNGRNPVGIPVLYLFYEGGLSESDAVSIVSDKPGWAKTMLYFDSETNKITLPDMLMYPQNPDYDYLYFKSLTYDKNHASTLDNPETCYFQSNRGAQSMGTASLGKKPIPAEKVGIPVKPDYIKTTGEQINKFFYFENMLPYTYEYVLSSSETEPAADASWISTMTIIQKDAQGKDVEVIVPLQSGTGKSAKISYDGEAKYAYVRTKKGNFLADYSPVAKILLPERLPPIEEAKLLAIEALNNYLVTLYGPGSTKESIYRTAEQTLYQNALNAGIANINAVPNDYQPVQEGVDKVNTERDTAMGIIALIRTNKQWIDIEVGQAKAPAIDSVTTYGTEKLPRCTPENQQLILDIIADATAAINAVVPNYDNTDETYQAIITIADEAKAAIDAIPEDGDLGPSKTQAIAELNAYVTDISIYRDEQKAEIAVAIEAGIANINAATSVAMIVNKLNTAEAAINAILTDEEMTKNEFVPAFTAAISDTARSTALTVTKTAVNSASDILYTVAFSDVNTAPETGWSSFMNEASLAKVPVPRGGKNRYIFMKLKFSDGLLSTVSAGVDLTGKVKAPNIPYTSNLNTGGYIKFQWTYSSNAQLGVPFSMDIGLGLQAEHYDYYRLAGYYDVGYVADANGPVTWTLYNGYMSGNFADREGRLPFYLAWNAKHPVLRYSADGVIPASAPRVYTGNDVNTAEFPADRYSQFPQTFGKYELTAGSGANYKFTPESTFMKLMKYVIWVDNDLSADTTYNSNSKYAWRPSEDQKLKTNAAKTNKGQLFRNYAATKATANNVFYTDENGKPWADQNFQVPFEVAITGTGSYYYIAPLTTNTSYGPDPNTSSSDRGPLDGSGYSNYGVYYITKDSSPFHDTITEYGGGGKSNTNSYLYPPTVEEGVANTTFVLPPQNIVQRYPVSSLDNANQAKPEGLAGTIPTSDTSNNGKITGVTSDMQYKLVSETDAQYKNVTGTEITGLDNGIYAVRYKGVAGVSNPSPIAYVNLNLTQAAPTGLTGVAPSLALYSDGYIEGVNNNMEFRSTKLATYGITTSSEYQVVAVVNNDPLDGLSSGTYNIRFKARDGFNASPVTQVVVPEGTNEVQPKPLGTIKGTAPTDPLKIDGKITGTSLQAVLTFDDIEYKLSTDTVYTSASGTEILGLQPGTYNLRYKSVPRYNAGTILNVVVPANNYPQAEPTSLIGIDPNNIAGDNGMITGTDIRMEYKLSTSTTYTAAPAGQIIGLKAGLYNVRYAGRLHYAPSAVVNIKVGTLYTVTFNSQGGSAVAPIIVGKGSSVPTLPAVTRAGYTFLGWNTGADGKGTNYLAGASFTPSGDVTLYAIWKKGATGGTGDPGDPGLDPLPGTGVGTQQHTLFWYFSMILMAFGFYFKKKGRQTN